MTVTYCDFDMSDMTLFLLGSGDIKYFLASKSFVL